MSERQLCQLSHIHCPNWMLLINVHILSILVEGEQSEQRLKRIDWKRNECKLKKPLTIFLAEKFFSGVYRFWAVRAYLLRNTKSFLPPVRLLSLSTLPGPAALPSITNGHPTNKFIFDSGLFYFWRTSINSFFVFIKIIENSNNNSNNNRRLA